MFDAKKLLDAMLAANQAPAAPQGGAQPPQNAGLGGILGSVLGQLGQAPAQANAAPPAGGAPAGGLGGALGGLLGGAGLGGVLQKIGAGGQGGAGGLDAVLGQLAQGGGGDLLNKVKQMAGQNQLATGAVLGGLAGLFLGSKAGRGLTIDAAKLGGLAAIGGLAYQAWQNYQAGAAPAATAALPAPAAAPAESPFGETASPEQDNATAHRLLQAMIAAASADGVIDEAERQAILGGLQQLGLDTETAQFLQGEFAHPATVEALAEGVEGQEMAAQVYTAARLTIDPDEESETAFLTALGQALGLDPNLVAHIDAAAESAKVSA